MEGNMAEISNNLLAALLIVAVVISIVGLVNIFTLAPVIRYTGVATGKANVSIESQLSIKLLRNETLFGSGSPNLAATGTAVAIWSNRTSIQVDGDASSDIGAFNNGSQGNGTDYNTGTYVYPFVVENDGNDPDTCIRISAAQAAASFIGGVAQTPHFYWAAMANESTWGSTQSGAPSTLTANPCIGTGTALVDEWTEMTTSSATVCDPLNATDWTDELRIHFRLEIPTDASGGKQTTVTVSGCNPCGGC